MVKRATKEAAGKNVRKVRLKSMPFRILALAMALVLVVSTLFGYQSENYIQTTYAAQSGSSLHVTLNGILDIQEEEGLYPPIDDGDQQPDQPPTLNDEEEEEKEIKEEVEEEEKAEVEEEVEEEEAAAGEAVKVVEVFAPFANAVDPATGIFAQPGVDRVVITGQQGWDTVVAELAANPGRWTQIGIFQADEVPTEINIGNGFVAPPGNLIIRPVNNIGLSTDPQGPFGQWANFGPNRFARLVHTGGAGTYGIVVPSGSNLTLRTTTLVGQNRQATGVIVESGGTLNFTEVLGWSNDPVGSRTRIHGFDQGVRNYGIFNMTSSQIVDNNIGIYNRTGGTTHFHGSTANVYNRVRNNQTGIMVQGGTVNLNSATRITHNIAQGIYIYGGTVQTHNIGSNRSNSIYNNGYGHATATGTAHSIILNGGTFITHALSAGDEFIGRVLVDGGTFTLRGGNIVGGARGNAASAALPAIDVRSGTFTFEGGNVGHPGIAAQRPLVGVVVSGGTATFTGGQIFPAATGTGVRVDGGTVAFNGNTAITGGLIGLQIRNNTTVALNNAQTVIQNNEHGVILESGVLNLSGARIRRSTRAAVLIQDGHVNMTGGEVKYSHVGYHLNHANARLTVNGENVRIRNNGHALPAGAGLIAIPPRTNGNGGGIFVENAAMEGVVLTEGRIVNNIAEKGGGIGFGPALSFTGGPGGPNDATGPANALGVVANTFEMFGNRIFPGDTAVAFTSFPKRNYHIRVNPGTVSIRWLMPDPANPGNLIYRMHAFSNFDIQVREGVDDFVVRQPYSPATSEGWLVSDVNIFDVFPAGGVNLNPLVNQSFTQVFTYSGHGTAPLNVEVAGAMPAGLQFNATRNGAPLTLQPPRSPMMMPISAHTSQSAGIRPFAVVEYFAGEIAFTGHSTVPLLNHTTILDIEDLNARGGNQGGRPMTFNIQNWMININTSHTAGNQSLIGISTPSGQPNLSLSREISPDNRTLILDITPPANMALNASSVPSFSTAYLPYVYLDCSHWRVVNLPNGDYGEVLPSGHFRILMSPRNGGTLTPGPGGAITVTPPPTIEVEVDEDGNVVVTIPPELGGDGNPITLPPGGPGGGLVTGPNVDGEITITLPEPPGGWDVDNLPSPSVPPGWEIEREITDPGGDLVITIRPGIPPEIIVIQGPGPDHEISISIPGRPDLENGIILEVDNDGKLVIIIPDPELPIGGWHPDNLPNVILPPNWGNITAELEVVDDGSDKDLVVTIPPPPGSTFEEKGGGGGVVIINPPIPIIPGPGPGPGGGGNGGDGNGGGSGGGGSGGGGSGGSGSGAGLGFVRSTPGLHPKYILGFEDRTVRPDQTVTRAEAAMMLFSIIEDPEKYNTTGGRFNDVVPGSWYEQAVNHLTAIGIFVGYPDGTFMPNAMINRAEIAAITFRFFGTSIAPLVEATTGFDDVDTQHWAANYINTARSNNWVVGYPDGTFRPNNETTRAEKITILNRALNKNVSPSEIQAALNGRQIFSDLTPQHWAFYQIMAASISHEYTISPENIIQWTWFELLD